MKIKYIAVIKEWRDKLYGNTYFAASIDDLVKDKVYKIPFQYGYGSHSESICKKHLGLEGFNSELPIKFVTVPNCKQREVKQHGQERYWTMKTKTDAIYSTALAYTTYKSISKNIDDNTLKNMFNDLCFLCDEYGFDYKQELKEKVNNE